MFRSGLVALVLVIVLASCHCKPVQDDNEVTTIINISDETVTENSITDDDETATKNIITDDDETVTENIITDDETVTENPITDDVTDVVENEDLDQEILDKEALEDLDVKEEQVFDETTTTTTEVDKTPVITSEPSMIQFFTVGQPFVLVCTAVSAFGPVTGYAWTKNGRPFNVNDQIFRESPNNGNILFVSPQLADIGTYQCEAENAFGKTFSQASLLMMQRPRDQPRRLDLSSPIAAQVLVDPVAEDKDNIPRTPILEAVPELLPPFVNNELTKPVFVVLPQTQSDEEPFEVIEMQTMDNSDEEIEDTEGSIEDTETTEETIEDTKSTAETIEDTEGTEETIENTEGTEETIEDTESTEETIEDTKSTEETIEDTEEAIKGTESTEETIEKTEKVIEGTEDAESTEETIEETEVTEEVTTVETTEENPEDSPADPSR